MDDKDQVYYKPYCTKWNSASILRFIDVTGKTVSLGEKQDTLNTNSVLFIRYLEGERSNLSSNRKPLPNAPTSQLDTEDALKKRN